MIPECDNHDHPLNSVLTASPQVCQRAAGIFRALGDLGRLQVMTLLAQREMCVTEISAALDEQMTTISQRLKLLRSERLVRSRREGKHLFYSLSDQHVLRLVSNAMDHAEEPDG